MVMAELCARVHQDRDQGIEALLQFGIAVDVDHIDRETELAANRRERGKHVVAQMAVAAAIEREPQHSRTAIAA